MHAYWSLATLNRYDGTKQDQGQLVLNQEHVTKNERCSVLHSMRAKDGIIRRVITGDLRRNSEYIVVRVVFRTKICA